MCRTCANFLARSLPIDRLPCSISEMWRCGMPVRWASWLWVTPSLLRAARNMRPGSTASGMGGNASRQGIVSRVSASSNPNACNASRAASAWSTGPTKARVHTGVLVGGSCVRTDIDHFHQPLLAVPDVPHRDIGWTAPFEVAVVPCAGELAIVGPIPPHRALPLQLRQEQAQEVLHGLGEGPNDFHNLTMERKGPGHRHTIPTNGITSRRR